ncbi:MAG: DUF5683 domain-containing protein [Balneolaceae bacterium]|nr:DUF5683 domain-containing protein [Balneolaceae bacterium]
MKKYFGLFVCAFLLLVSKQAISQEADSSSTGYLSISANVDSFLVVLNQKFQQPINFASEDSISLERGDYSVILVHPEFRDLRLNATIRPDSTQRFRTSFVESAQFDSTQSSYTRITEGIDTNFTIQTDPNSLIIIDDSIYGRGYYSGDIGPYRHDIRVEHDGARPKRESVYIEPSGSRELTLYALPLKNRARLYGLVPGTSQIYKNQLFKGSLFATLFSASVVFGVVKHLDFNNQNSEYEEMLAQYQLITGEQDALEYGNRVDNKFDRINSLARSRDYALYAAVGLYVANILDALLSKPASGYRVHVEPADFARYGNQSAGISLQIGIR